MRPQVSAELSRLFDWARQEYGVVALSFDRASDLGLQPTDFLDYGHLSGRGARIFTRHLADQLRQRWASGTRSAVRGGGRESDVPKVDDRDSSTGASVPG